VLVGAEYQSTISRFSTTDLLSFFDYSNIHNPVYGQTPSIEPSEKPFLPYSSIISRKGIYLQDQLMFFNEKVHLLLGARIGRSKQGNHYFQDQLPGTEYEGNEDDIIGKTVFTPRVGLVYKPKTWTSLYISYSKGYEINSPVLLAQNYKEYMNPPATLSSQVEFGTKSNLFNDRLGVTLTVFEINKHNPYGYVYLNPDNPDYDKYNVYYEGHHRSRGVELDASGKITRTLSLTAGAAYTRTKVMEDPGYPTGSLLPGAPKITANLWVNYEPHQQLKGLILGAGWFYKDKFFSSIANDPHLEIPSGYTIDVSAGYKYKQAGIQLNVMNITNQVNYLNPWQFNLFDVRPLRQLVVTLSYRIGK
jgi:iron complex outermembrane receptor protein